MVWLVKKASWWTRREHVMPHLCDERMLAPTYFRAGPPLHRLFDTRLDEEHS